MKQALLAICFAGAVLAQTATKSTPAAKAATPAAPAADLLHPATLNRMAPAVYRVKLATTKGDIIIEVTRSLAPHGADRFYNLVRSGYFTDCAFYRVIPNFMAQFGISARPEVNRAFQGATIPDDPRNAQSNTRGKVTFASTGAPNSRNNALFINLVDNKYLDTQGFVPIGEVVEGMGTVDMLYNGYGATENHQPDFENGGKAYVDRSFPKLDRILTATILPATPAGTPAAPAAAPKSTTKSTTAGPKT
ncbi:MAG TPA: peptidylprolyl isomerase [Bryobacteraceae bacterium]|jgi:peptidyl-prolyl cis-trans isomerase A (cyclophilin A)